MESWKQVAISLVIFTAFVTSGVLLQVRKVNALLLFGLDVLFFSVLEVNFNIVHSINSRFIFYLLTFTLVIYFCEIDASSVFPHFQLYAKICES